MMARTVAGLPPGTRISDHVTLGVLTTTVPASLIDAVLSDTGKQSHRYPLVAGPPGCLLRCDLSCQCSIKPGQW